MSDLYWLTDEQMARLLPDFPNSLCTLLAVFSELSA